MNAFGQPHSSIDSLKAIIDLKTGISKYEPLISLVREHAAASNYTAALKVAEDAYELAMQHADLAKIVQSGRIRGQLLSYLDRRKEALLVLTETLGMAERNNQPDEYKTILTNIANAHTFLADYDTALKYHFKVLAMSEDDSDSLNISFAHNNIGLVYYKIKNFGQALYYFQKALTIRSIKRHNIEGLFINLGLCLNEMDRFEEAKQYFARALQECSTRCNAEITLNAGLGLGVSCFHLSDYDSARKYFELSHGLAIKMNNKRLTAENLLWLAKISIEHNRLEDASEALQDVVALTIDEGYHEILIRAYEELSQVSERHHDFKSASSYLKKYIALKEKIYSEEVMDNLAKAKTAYEERENLATIQAREMTISQQRRFVIAVIIIALLITLLLSVVWRKNRVIKSAKDLISEQNQRLQIRNRELDVLVEGKTKQLRLANVSLKEMNDELNTFIFKASQEILAPLATLKGICHVAGLDIMDKLSLNYLHRINNTITLLNSAFKRLLVINKLNQAKTRSEEINLKGIVEDVLSLQRQKGLPQNLVLRRSVSKNAVVNCDQELLSAMLENSIENAIKCCKDANETGLYFINIDVSPKNGRVNVRIVHNGVIDKQENFYPLFLEEYESNDLYFLKTTAAKVGGKVDLRKTPEGYNELSVVF